MNPKTLLVLLITLPTQAASFNCAKATSPQEKAICATPELSRLDDQLSAAYKSALTQLSPQAQTNLREDQSAWQNWLATICQPSKDLAKCMTTPYRDRTKTLQKSITRKDSTTFYTRTISLAHRDDPMPPEVPSGEYNGIGYITINYPQADNPTPALATWNQAIHTTIQQFTTFNQTSSLTPNDAKGADTDTTATIQNLTPTRIDTSMSLFTMGHGAAHPAEAYAIFHWLLRQNRAMLPTDIFRTNTTWQPALAQHCWQALKKQFPGKDSFLLLKSPSDKSLLDVIRDPDNWQILPSGLKINFPEYSVTPRVAPAAPVLVPWSTLKPYLVPAFDPSS